MKRLYEQLKHKNKNAETYIERLKGKIKILKETKNHFTDKLPENIRSCKEIWETDLQ